MALTKEQIEQVRQRLQSSSSASNQPVKVTARDVLREVPTAAKTVLGKVKDFAIDVARGLPRAIGTSVATFARPANKVGEYDPTVNPLTKFVFGKEPIRAIEERGTKTLSSFGVGQEKAGLYGPAAGLTAVLPEFIPGFSSSKKYISSIAKSTDVNDIISNLSKLKIGKETAEELAPRLVNVQSPSEVANILKSRAVLKKIEQEVGQSTPKAVRDEVERRMMTISSLGNPKFETKAIDDLVEEVVSNAPKIESAEPLLQEARKYKSAEELLKGKEGQMVKVPIDLLHKGKPVSGKVEERVAKLADDIRKSGSITPLSVTDDGFVVDGFHRLEALKKLGVSEVPVYVGKQSGSSGRLEGGMPFMNQNLTDFYNKATKVETKRGFGSGAGRKKSDETVEKPLTREEAYGKVNTFIKNLNPKEIDDYEAQSTLETIAKNLSVKSRKPEEVQSLMDEAQTVVDDLMKERGTAFAKKSEMEDAFETAKESPSFEEFMREMATKSASVAKKFLSNGSMAKKFFISSKQGNFAGAIAGFETDEEGNIKFDGYKAALGVGAATVTRSDGAEEVLKLASTRYKGVIQEAKKGFSIFRKSQEDVVTAKSDSALKAGLEKLLTPVSTRLGKIDESLKIQLRKLEMNSMVSTMEDTKKILPMLQFQKNLSKEDRAIFDLARKNGDGQTIKAMAEKYDFTEELKQTREVLDDIYDRAKAVGMEMGHTKDYFPRQIKDTKGFLDYFAKGDDWSVIQEAINEKAIKMGKKPTDLTDDEKASLVNSLIRGYGNKITLSAPGATKERSIEIVTSDLNKFYEKSDAALVEYVVRMNDEIAARKFFGKELSVDGNQVNVDDSIGAYVMKLVVNGKIKPSQEKEVSDIFKARFNRGKMNGFLSGYRNMEYLSTMGSPTSAITQIGDMAWTLYENGIYHSIKGLAKASFNKGIKRTDLGIERIAQEFTEPSRTARAVEKTFKLIGLDRMDRLGKETFINANFSKLSAQARSGSKDLAKTLNRTFGEDEAKLALQELKDKKMTERTKFMVFSRLLDYQPAAKSEMPEVYLNSPNGRIFYMLKSFTLKQIDVFRREALDKMASGTSIEKARGLKNLILLSGAFMAANATADEIKDLILGRETSAKDRTIDNIARLFGATKYDVYKARTEGLGKTILTKILFPTSIFDRAYKDITTAGDGKGTDSVQDIPLGGKFYYWWFGKGAGKTNDKQRETQKYEKYGLKDVEDTRDAYKKLSKLPPKRANAIMSQMKKDNPRLHTSVSQVAKEEKLGITKRERSFKSMGVADGERAEEINKYILSQKGKRNATYKKLKQAGIISDEVDKQIRELNKKN